MPSTQSAIDQLVAELEADLDSVIAAIVAALREQVPGYRLEDGLSDADIIEVLRVYLMEVISALRGEPGPSLEMTDAVMERRAEAGISLPQMLHSYRVGIQTLWSHLARRAQERPSAAETVIVMTPTIFEMLDRFSLRAHEIHTRLAVRTARRREQIRVSWLDSVLQVDPAAGAEFWEAAAHLGIPRDGTFTVIESGPHGDEPPDLEAPLRARPSVRSVWLRTGASTQVGLVSFVGTRSDVDAALAPVIDAAGLRGGASSPFSSIGEIGRAVAQARVAYLAATAQERYVRYDRRPLAVLLASAPTAADSLIDETLSAVFALPEQRRRALLDAVSSWLECGQSLSATAAALHLHRNTVTYRLQRFEEIAGGSLSDPIWVAQVLLALAAVRQGQNRPAAPAGRPADLSPSPGDRPG